MSSEAGPVDPAEVLAVDITALPGVAALHGGMFGEVATYLPGRRVTGIRLDQDHTDVHVSVEWGSSVHDVVAAVRSVTVGHVGGRVDVYVEDVVPPGAGSAAPTRSPEPSPAPSPGETP